MAQIRVLPGQTGYGIHVVVRKELEDVARPELATVGGLVQRHDGSLIRPQGPRVGGAVSLGWIPLGRDVALEQKILTDIHRRFNLVPAPPPIHKQQAKFLKAARKAALAGDAATVKSNLLAWGKLQWPENAPRSIGDLATRVSMPWIRS